jgi:galactokinase
MPDIGQNHRNEYELGLGRSIPVAVAAAPGRIHFLGGQGDPATGIYLCAAIDRFIHLAVNMRKDNSFRFYAVDLNERKRSSLSNIKYRREDRWANYIKTAVSLFMDLGYPMRGLNVSFSGDIPQQIGLASSTAIEAAAAAALRSLFRVHISDSDLAQRLYEAHLKFFGTEASLADYQVCLLAKKDQFLFIDSSSGEIKKFKSPLSGFRILLVDSRVPRMGIESEIVSRNTDTVKGLEFLTEKFDGVNYKDFGSKDLLDALGDFPEQIRRRSVHIVDEIHRVNDACQALQRSDIASLAKIIYHSHESLRDFYEISCPELDWLVKRAQELEGAAGSRMTGHGFGGCTYTIIRRELIEEYRRRLEDYERIFGFRPVIYEVKIAAGARIIHERREVYADTVN